MNKKANKMRWCRKKGLSNAPLQALVAACRHTRGGTRFRGVRWHGPAAFNAGTWVAKMKVQRGWPASFIAQTQEPPPELVGSPDAFAGRERLARSVGTSHDLQGNEDVASAIVILDFPQSYLPVVNVSNRERPRWTAQVERRCCRG